MMNFTEYQFGKSLNSTEKEIKPEEVEKTILNVHYKMKNQAKELGAKWDKDLKKWYVQKNNINYDELINKFNNVEVIKENKIIKEDEIYKIDVPYNYKNIAKSMGVKYNKKYGSYIYKNHPNHAEILEIFEGFNFKYDFYNTHYIGPQIKGFELPNKISNK